MINRPPYSRRYQLQLVHSIGTWHSSNFTHVAASRGARTLDATRRHSSLRKKVSKAFVASTFCSIDSTPLVGVSGRNCVAGGFLPTVFTTFNVAPTPVALTWLAQ